MGFHMQPPEGILGALPAQEALWLCLDATFSDFLLVVDGFDARSRLGSTLAICDL